MRSLRLLAAALIVPASLFIVAPAHAATITVCAVGCDQTTVQAAVTAANAGDTIEIEAGTYDTFGVIINKPLTITGAGNSTILDGGGASVGTVPGIFRVLPGAPANGAGEITISDMLLRNTSKNTTASTYFAISMGVKQVTTGITDITVDNLTIEGTNDAAKPDYGIYADGGYTNNTERIAPDLTISNSTISGTRYNNIGVDAWVAPVTISDNTLQEGTIGNSSILVFNEYTPNQITDPVRILDNTSTGRLVYIRNIDINPTLESRGGFADIGIQDNTVNGLAGTDAGILVSTNSLDGAAPTRMGTVDVTNNRISGDSTTSTVGIQISGYVDDATIEGNNIFGVGNGVGVGVVKGQNPVSVSAQHNRLFADTNGVLNVASTDVDATENWWGCQTDPLLGGSFCSDASNTGSGSIDVDPWVVTTAALGSNSILAGASTSIDTDLGHLSDGSTVALPSFFAGLTSAFAATAGTVNPTAGTLDGSFADSSNYTAPLVAGPQTITVAIDEFNGQTGEPVELPITITALPIDNGGGGSGGPDPDDGGVGGVGGVDDDSALPDTGTSTPEWLIFLSTFAVMLGALVVWSNRTRRPAGRHILT